MSKELLDLPADFIDMGSAGSILQAQVKKLKNGENEAVSSILLNSPSTAQPSLKMVKSRAAPAGAENNEGTDHTGFKALGLSRFMVSRCKDLGFTTPSGVQAACIPAILSGENVIANSPTGTGKTLTFGIPIVQCCNKDPHPGYSLVLTPTRELASQIADQFRSIGGSTPSVACVVGGVDFQEQSMELQTRPLHIIATPGRLADHFETNQVETRALFRNLKFLVIDEADRVLGGDFDEQLKIIMDNIPGKGRQILFFSATTTDDLRVLAKAMSASREPFIYDYFGDKPEERIIDRTMKQYYIFCPPDYKDGYFMELLRMIRENEFDDPVRSMIIFAPTCKDCNILGGMMKDLNFPNIVLHSHLKQKDRLEALATFKSRQITTLIATDVASRGLDIQTVDLVVNYHVPFASDYVHRIGRAGRAGQNGLAITFITCRDIPLLHAIETVIEEKLVELKINERSVLLILNEVNATKRTVILRMGDDPHEERMRIYQRKREILDGLVDDTDSSNSDDTSLQVLNSRRKPKRARLPSQ